MEILQPIACQTRSETREMRLGCTAKKNEAVPKRVWGWGLKGTREEVGVGGLCEIVSAQKDEAQQVTYNTLLDTHTARKLERRVSGLENDSRDRQGHLLVVLLNIRSR